MTAVAPRKSTLTFTDSEVKSLEETMSLIRDRRVQFADSFYERLFRQWPQVKPLFAHVDMMAQRDKLIASLALLVSHLRNPEGLEKEFRRLGDRHVGYKVSPDHYPVVEEALIQNFASFLADKWNSEHETAWRTTLKKVSEIMIQGSHPN